MTTDLDGFPEDLLYDTHYQWIRRSCNTVSFGLSNYGLEITGDVLYLSLPLVGTVVQGGETCGSMEAGKWVGRIYAPVSGKVISVNQGVLDNPATINNKPYHAWFAEIEMFQPEELNNLMSAADVRTWLTEDGRQYA